MDSPNYSENVHESNVCDESTIVTYQRVKVEDSMDSDILAHVNQIVKFIENAPNNVLIHCTRGMCMAPAVFIIAVMKMFKMTLSNALKEANRICEKVILNDRVKRDLMNLEKEIFSSDVPSINLAPPRQRREMIPVKEEKSCTKMSMKDISDGPNKVQLTLEKFQPKKCQIDESMKVEIHKVIPQVRSRTSKVMEAPVTEYTKTPRGLQFQAYHTEKLIRHKIHVPVVTKQTTLPLVSKVTAPIDLEHETEENWSNAKRGRDEEEQDDMNDHTIPLLQKFNGIALYPPQKIVKMEK
jgi:hypothetical protein